MASLKPTFITQVAESLLLTSGCPSVRSVAETLGLSEVQARASLEALALANAIELKDDIACVRSRAELAAAAIRLGGDPERISRRLDWRDFEALVASALQEAGFSVSRSVRLPGRGGLEVDVVGASGRVAVAVDCKRWSYRSSSPSRIGEAARRHRLRSQRLASIWGSLSLPKASVLVPALVVLREDLPRFVEGVAVVPVLALRGFIEDLEAVADEVGIRVA